MTPQERARARARLQLRCIEEAGDDVEAGLEAFDLLSRVLPDHQLRRFTPRAERRRRRARKGWEATVRELDAMIAQRPTALALNAVRDAYARLDARMSSGVALSMGDAGLARLNEEVEARIADLTDVAMQ